MKNTTTFILLALLATIVLVAGMFIITTEHSKLANHKITQLETQLRQTQDSLSVLKKEVQYQNKGYYTISPIDSQTVLVDGTLPIFTKDLEAFLYDEYYSINEHDYTAEW